GSVSGARVTARSKRELARIALPWVLAVALGALAAAGWMNARRRPVSATIRFGLDIPARQRFVMVNGVPVVFSPDGRAILYSGIGGPQTRQLYYRRLDELEALPLPGTEDANTAFFSADGKTVGFTKALAVYRVSVNGGAPTLIAGGGKYGSFRSPSWAANGDMYLGTSRGLVRIQAGQQAPEPLTNPDSTKGELGHGTPILGPDGNTVIYWVRAVPPRTDHLALLRLDTKETRDIEGAAVNPLGVLDGFLLF